jgi:hypothetical protein
MWYVGVLVKTVPRRKCPWGAKKEIELFTTPSIGDLSQERADAGDHLCGQFF